MDTPRPADPLAALRAGLAGRYDIERELGAGGMAVVYLARDIQHQRQVALKVLSPELGGAFAERFHREIHLAARLVHPHILPLLDSGETAGRLWYTMPFIEGESLRDRLVREKLLPVGEAIRLTREIAGALSHAHAKGILHRDIKPENILLADGQALVADFGIARALGGDTGDRLTGTGVAIGTPGYMSPEQSSGEHQLDARSDLYSLASVCYEMLVGEPPFTGPTAQAVIARRLSQPPPSLRTTRASIPEPLDAAIRRALAPVPADRYASTAEFSDALAAAVTGEQASPVSKHRWPLLAVAAVLVLAATGYWMAIRRAGASADTADRSSGIRLAVMPFRLIGSDSGDRYLADGITEEVSSALSNLSGLRVIAQSSVESYAGEGKSAREIGSALQAEALVEGDVQRAGSAVRVRVRLVDPATEELKWSQQYDHTTQDVFRIQSEVASKIAGVLRIQLAERESRSLSRPPTTNAEAYDAYLRARARGLPTNIDHAAFDSAIGQLADAVRLDSTFALAWGTLAAYQVGSVFLFDADPARLDAAEQNIRRALALDSTLAMALRARGDLGWNAVRGWHFPEALADLRHAIALQPSLVEAHRALGSLFFHYGFLDEADRELATSLSLDPRDGCADPTNCIGFSRPRVARVLWYRQQFDSALAVYNRLPFVGGFVWEKAVVLNALGRAADGLALLDSAATPGDPESADREATRALLHATLGQKAEAELHLAATAARRESASHFHHAQFTIACAYARLGKKAEAVEWLRRTAENGMPNYPLFRNDPNLRVLQGDPSYEALMTRLKQQHEEFGKLVSGG
jgi:eukaryotic-like serine/threonine-protein kinase